jgi:prophage DNA circulation protein
MYKADVNEAVPICQRVLSYALTTVATRGRPGSDVRTAIGSFIANAPTLLRNDQAGPPLADVFDKLMAAGITLPQLAAVRAQAELEAPLTVGALLVKNSLIHFTYSTGGFVLVNTTFTSRDDVDRVRQQMNDAFAVMEEVAADDMDQEIFQALIRLHAAIMFYLIETARPLPRMLNFQFASPSLPTLIIAYRLYADARRADELRAENKVVHPAFARPFGRALSN